MRVFLKVDQKNYKQIVDFYFNTLIEILNTGKTYSAILQEIPDLKKQLYSYYQNEIASQIGNKIEFDYNLKVSNSNTKFVKTAQWQMIVEALGAEGMKEIIAKGMSGDEGGILGKFESLFNKFPWLKSGLEYLKKIGKRAFSEITDIDLLKKILILNKTLEVAHEKERFSPSAYEHLFESKTGPRGIDGSYVSKGAYELPSKKYYDQLEQAKLEKPELFKNKYEYYDAPEFQYEKERQKPTIFSNDSKSESKEKPKPNLNFQPLYPKKQEANNKSKFVKTSQTAQNQIPVIEKDQVDQIRKLYPRWSMDDISLEIQGVSENSNLDDLEKQKQYEQIIAKYSKSIDPLHKYIQGLTKQK